MIPTLLVHDHILVKKWAYGIKIPFADQWIVRWSMPKRGDIVVFKFPENPEVYYIKRLVALPGDHVQMQRGVLTINGIPWKQTKVEKQTDQEEGFQYFLEGESGHKHSIRFEEDSPTQSENFDLKVPMGKYFFMGDNRDQSNDGRVWGFVNENLLVGPAFMVWLSCESMLESAPFFCDPSQLRTKRIFKFLQGSAD